MEDMDSLFEGMGDDILEMLHKARRTDSDEENTVVTVSTTELTSSSSSSSSRSGEGGTTTNAPKLSTVNNNNTLSDTSNILDSTIHSASATEMNARDRIIRHIVSRKDDLSRIFCLLDQSIGSLFNGLSSTVTASINSSSSTKLWSLSDISNYSYTILSSTPSVNIPAPELLPSVLNYYGIIRTLQERINKLGSSLPAYNKYDITNTEVRSIRLKLLPLFKLGLPDGDIINLTTTESPSIVPIEELLVKQLDNEENTTSSSISSTDSVDITVTVAELFILTDYLRPHLDTYRNEYGTDALNSLLRVLTTQRTVRQIFMFYMAEMLYASSKPSEHRTKLLSTTMDDSSYINFIQTRTDMLRITSFTELERNKLDSERILKIFRFVGGYGTPSRIVKLWHDSMDYFIQKNVQEQQNEVQQRSQSSSTVGNDGSSGTSKSVGGNLSKFFYSKTETSSSSEWISTKSSDTSSHHPSSSLSSSSSSTYMSYSNYRTFNRKHRRKEWGTKVLGSNHNSSFCSSWIAVCRLAQLLLVPNLTDAIVRSTLLILRDNERFDQQRQSSLRSLSASSSSDTFTYLDDNPYDSSIPARYGDHLSHLQSTMEQQEDQYRIAQEKTVHPNKTQSKMVLSSCLSAFLPLSDHQFTQAITILGEILYDILDPYNPFLFLLLSDATVPTKNNCPYVTPGTINVWNMANAFADHRLLTVLNFTACWYYSWVLYDERCPTLSHELKETKERRINPEETVPEKYGYAIDMVRRVYDANTIRALEAVGKRYDDRWTQYLFATMSPGYWPYNLDKENIHNAPFAKRNRCVVYSNRSWWTGSRCVYLVPPEDPVGTKLHPYVTTEDEETVVKPNVEEDDDEPVASFGGGELANLRLRKQQPVIEDTDDEDNPNPDTGIDKEEEAIPDVSYQHLSQILTFPIANSVTKFRSTVEIDTRFDCMYVPANCMKNIYTLPEGRPTHDVNKNHYTDSMKSLGIEVEFDRDAPYYRDLRSILNQVRRIMAWDEEWMKRNVCIYAGEPTNAALFGIFCFTLTDLQIQEIEHSRSFAFRGQSLRDSLHTSTIDPLSPQTSTSGLSSGLLNNGSNTIDLLSQPSVSMDNLLLDIKDVPGWPDSLTPACMHMVSSSKGKKGYSTVDIAEWYTNHPNEAQLPGPIVLAPGNLVRLATSAGHVHDRAENDHWIIAIQSTKSSVIVEALVRKENNVVRTTLSPDIDSLYFPGMKAALPLSRTNNQTWYFEEGESMEAENYLLRAETIANNFHRSLSRRTSIEWIRNGGSILQLTGIPEGLRFQHMHRYAVYFVVEHELLERLDTHGLLNPDHEEQIKEMMDTRKPSTLPSNRLLMEDLRVMRNKLHVPRLHDYYLRGWSTVENDDLAKSSPASIDDEPIDPPSLRKVFQPIADQIPTAISPFEHIKRERPLPMDWTPEANRIHRNEMEYIHSLQTWLDENKVSSTLDIPSISNMSVWLMDESFAMETTTSTTAATSTTTTSTNKPILKIPKPVSKAVTVSSPIDMTLSPPYSKESRNNSSSSSGNVVPPVESDTPTRKNSRSSRKSSTTNKRSRSSEDEKPKRSRSSSNAALSTIIEKENEEDTKTTTIQTNVFSSSMGTTNVATPERNHTIISVSPSSPDTGYIPSKFNASSSSMNTLSDTETRTRTNKSSRTDSNTSNKGTFTGSKKSQK